MSSWRLCNTHRLHVTTRVFASNCFIGTGSKPARHSRQLQFSKSSFVLLNQKNYCVSNDQNFAPIYKFPYIVPATAICRLKLYQTGITIAMVPSTFVLYGAGIATMSQCQTAFAVSCFACTILYVMSSFFRRLVGIMYLNNNRDTLKIAHLTFMGKRRDVLVPVEDIVPFADIGDLSNKVYYPLKFYSTDQYYYYIVRYGGILEPDLFKFVFGGEIIKMPKFMQKN